MSALIIALVASSFTGNPVTLTSSNHISLAGTVTDKSVRKWTRALGSCSADPMYLYINSPGGSVVAGHGFINALKHKQQGGQKIVCIAEFAASMAFAILQACPERAIMGHSIAMQHQMSLIVGGSLGAARSRMALAEQMERSLVEMQAKRLNLSREEFVSRTQDDWWLYGRDIITEKVADTFVEVGCGAGLLASKERKCPLTTSPGLEQQSVAGPPCPGVVLLPELVQVPRVP